MVKETRKSITIDIDIKLANELNKRAKKSYMSLRELIEDILRRSMLSYNKQAKHSSESDVEPFIKMFSKRKRAKKK